jgi:hypothetical protein
MGSTPTRDFGSLLSPKSLHHWLKRKQTPRRELTSDRPRRLAGARGLTTMGWGILMVGFSDLRHARPHPPPLASDIPRRDFPGRMAIPRAPLCCTSATSSLFHAGNRKLR